MSTAPLGGAGGEQAPDQTLAAIYNVAQTMGGDGGPDIQPQETTMASAGPNTQPNREAEKILIEAGIVGKGGSLQRATLGCMACQLDTRAGNGEGAALSQVARCIDRDPHPIRRMFQRLLESGVIASTTDTARGTVSARDRYVLGPTAATLGLGNALEKPATCGLQGGRDDLNTAAEQALIEAGAVENRSTTRRAALGCLACQIHEGEEGVYSLRVEQCQDIGHDTVIRAFGALVEEGVLEAHEEEGRAAARRPRVIYSPAYSPLGAQLRELLETPAECGLRKQQEGNK